MGWLRLVGSLKLQASFAECSLCCRALLQKRPINLRILLFDSYEVATISRLLKITGLFCKRALQKRLHSAKEACNFKEPTNRSHPIA